MDILARSELRNQLGKQYMAWEARHEVSGSEPRKSNKMRYPTNGIARNEANRMASDSKENRKNPVGERILS